MRANATQQAQILAALHAVPLDRVRLMKTLFLAWYRYERPKAGAFDFQPYLYGPCAFDVYGALEDLQQRGLVAQVPHPITRWAAYRLTEDGQRAAQAVPLSAEPFRRLTEIARWTTGETFRSLLEKVYAEAPEFAVASVFRQAGREQAR